MVMRGILILEAKGLKNFLNDLFKGKIVIKSIKYTHFAGQLTKTLKIGLSMSDFLKAIISMRGLG